MNIRSRKLILFILLISSVGVSYAESPRNASKLSNRAEFIQNPGVFYVTTKTKTRDLKNLPETTPIVLPRGTVVSAVDLNRVSRISKALRKNKKKDLPKALTLKTRKRGTRVNNLEDLQKALKRKDKETLILPSGERLTVGLLKLIQPQVEDQLGRGLTAKEGRAKVIKVSKKTDWKAVLQMPDNTILQAPNGKKITVIQLKSTLAKNVKGSSLNTNRRRRK